MTESVTLCCLQIARAGLSFHFSIHIMLCSNQRLIDHDIIQEIVAERDARKYFTPTELAYIDNPTPSEQENIRFAWRFESAWTLIWVLRLVREPLTTPRNTCDVDRSRRHRSAGFR